MEAINLNHVISNVTKVSQYEHSTSMSVECESNENMSKDKNKIGEDDLILRLISV